MGLLSSLIRIIYSCFLLLDAFRALKQVKARRRAATTTLTSADRLRRRNIKYTLSQTLVWVLYIALESATRKAAFLVPFYDYWNLLVLWIVTQKSQFVLAKVTQLVKPYEVVFDFIGDALMAITDFTALLPKYISRRWTGVFDSTARQEEPILANLPALRPAPPTPRRRSPPKAPLISSPQPARHVPTNQSRTASLASFRSQLVESQKDFAEPIIESGPTREVLQPIAVKTTRVRTARAKSTTSYPVIPAPIPTATAPAPSRKEQELSSRRSKVEDRASHGGDEEPDSDAMDLDDLRVDEYLSLPRPPPVNPAPLPTAQLPPSPLSPKVETPPSRTAFHKFSSALNHASSLAALATPAPPLPGGFTFSFPAPNLYPQLPTLDEAAFTPLPLSPVQDVRKMDVHSAIGTQLPKISSPTRSTSRLDPITQGSSRQKAYRAIDSLTADHENYNIESLLAKKSKSSTLPKPAIASSEKAGVIGAMRGKKRIADEVEVVERKVPRGGGMKDVGSLSRPNAAPPGAVGGRPPVAGRYGVEKTLKRKPSQTTLLESPGAKKGTSTARPCGSEVPTPPNPTVEQEKLVTVPSPIRPISRTSRIAKSKPLARPMTSIAARKSLLSPSTATPAPQAAVRTSNSLPKSRSMAIPPPARSVVVPSSSIVKLVSSAQEKVEVVPTTSRATRATRASAKK